MNGLTARCVGFNMTPGQNCGRRVPTLEAKLCHQCAREKNLLEFKEEFARPENRWYMEWVFYYEDEAERTKMFICRTCGVRTNADRIGIPDGLGNLVPAAACCTNTMSCKRAEEFWGHDGHHTFNVMLKYILDVRPEIPPR